MFAILSFQCDGALLPTGALLNSLYYLLQKMKEYLTNALAKCRCRGMDALTLGRKTGGRKVFLEFFGGELSFRPAVFSSCVYIPKTLFDTRLVRIGYYGYEI